MKGKITMSNDIDPRMYGEQFTQLLTGFVDKNKATETVMSKGKDAKLTINELAEALYEGTPHLHNLAEKLARQHGKAGALTFYGMMGEDIRNFYRGIAKQLIDHAKEWEENNGCACVLSKRESERLKNLPRVLWAE